MSRSDRVLLWGPPGSGKTSLGGALAARLGRPFVDLDARVAARTGASIDALFARGEAAFRAEERDALAEVLADTTPRVIALGGGTLVDPALRERALREGFVLGLDAAEEVLRDRLAAAGGRPLLAGDLDARLAALLGARAAAYRVAHAHVRTDRAAPADLAARVASWIPRAIPITVAADRAYCVRLDDAALALGEQLATAQPSRAVIVTDATVAPLHADRLVAALVDAGLPALPVSILPAGEAEKTLATTTRLLESLRDLELDRRSLVIGLGGGVVTDQAGLAAALYQRGVRWVAVPTTLMGMVDAAIGGKTATNLGPAKNAVGAFHHPLAVIVDARFSLTESERNVRSGLAEVVKCAVLGDEALFVALEAQPPDLRDVDRLQELITRSAAIKAHWVEADPAEAGPRARLNLGHTLGHALEAATGFGTLTHGEAVAIGLVAATRVAERVGLAEEGLSRRISALYGRLGLPVSPPPGALQAALELLRLDKKRAGGALQLVLPERLGAVHLVTRSLEESCALFGENCDQS